MKNAKIRVAIVDDEELPAAYLQQVLSSFDDVEVVGVYDDPTRAVSEIGELLVDAVFADIEMPGMSGLELLGKIKLADPMVEVVMVTGYDSYALKAFEGRALGYLMKPTSRDDVAYYIDQVRELRRRRRKRVFEVRTFGAFDVFADGTCVMFANAKAKELLALLVDARGAEVSIERISYVLWEDHAFDESVKALVRRAVSDLRRAAREYGCDDLLVSGRGSVALNRQRINCDFYDYLESGQTGFDGTYMEQYSWAEETAAQLFHGTIGRI